MTNSSHKAKLRILLAEVRAAEQTLWDSLSAEERNAVGEIDRWSAKDHLAHVTFWTERLVTQLRAANVGEAPKKIDDFQKTNEEVFTANKDRTWEDLRIRAEEVSRQFQTAFNSVSEEMLEANEVSEGEGGRPLWQNVAFTGVYHPLHHVADLYLGRDDFGGAQSLQERIAEGMVALDESDTWRGSTVYNLACFYALHDKPRQALARLAAALEYAPNLKGLSKQDADLDSLRELPEFQAILADR